MHEIVDLILKKLAFPDVSSSFTCHSVLPPADLAWYYTVASPTTQYCENNQFLLGADHLGVLIPSLSLFSMKAKHRV